MNKALTIFKWDTEEGEVKWRWKEDGSPSPQYKSLNYQWWISKKSDFEIISAPSSVNKQEIRNAIWEDLQGEINYFKDLYKLHKANKIKRQDG